MFGTFNYSNIEAMDKINVDGLHLDYYPLFFDQDTANRIIKELDSLDFPHTFYREADKKLKLCTKGAAWFVDYNAHPSAKDWNYTVCKDHVNGIIARPLKGTIQQLSNLIENFTGKAYNAVLVRKFKHGKDCTSWSSNQDPWLGETFDTPCLSFGVARKLEFRKKLSCVPPRIDANDTETQKEGKTTEKLKNQKATLQNYSLESGSLIIMKDPTQKMWQHRVPYDEDIIYESYHMIFRNVRPQLIHKQIQKYNKIVDHRLYQQLLNQWKHDQKVESKVEDDIDKEMYDKTEEGIIEKQTEIASKKALKTSKGFFESLVENTGGWLANPVNKPPPALRTPGKLYSHRNTNAPIVPLEKQLSGTTNLINQPIATMRAEDLERKIKKETGRDIHIKYRGRNESSKKSKKKLDKHKTVIVDLTNAPNSPEINKKVSTDDIKASITRVYTQLLPIKEIDPDLFDHKMKSASDQLKKSTSKSELIAAETEIFDKLQDFKQEAINSIKEQGLISESEYQQWKSV